MGRDTSVFYSKSKEEVDSTDEITISVKVPEFSSVDELSKIFLTPSWINFISSSVYSRRRSGIVIFNLLFLNNYKWQNKL